MTTESIMSVLIEWLQLEHDLNKAELEYTMTELAYDSGIDELDINEFWAQHALVYVHWQGRYLITPRFAA